MVKANNNKKTVTKVKKAEEVKEVSLDIETTSTSEDEINTSQVNLSMESKEIVEDAIVDPEEDLNLKEELKDEVTIDLTESNPLSKEKMVKINPKEDMRTYIGDQYYNLKKGKVISVPQNVKDILQRAGCLDPL